MKTRFTFFSVLAVLFTGCFQKERIMRRTNLLALTLLLLLCAVSQGAFKFVAWADNRPYDATNEARFVWMLEQMNLIVGDEPKFHVVVGDYDYTSITAADIAEVSLIQTWYRATGNHDTDDFNLPNSAVDLPVVDPQARFIFLNQYQCPDGVSGCDCSMGRICPHARAWLDRECLSAPEGFPIFVVAHEPAFPENRHVGDSLDLHPEDRDAFWAILGQYGATYICGHTHYYSTYSSGGATQIDVGNAGNPGESHQTFVIFDVNGTTVTRTVHTTEYNVSAYPPATNPLPANGATGLSTTPVLTWTAGNGAILYNVYFGPVTVGLPATPEIVTDSSCRIKDLPGYESGLNYEAQYVWRVDVVYDAEHIIQGPVWTFTTKEELAVRYAVGETMIDGSVLGDIDGTERRDDVYEILTETLNVPNKNGYGALEHIWQFNNIPTGKNLQFRIEAHRSALDLADDFVMSYSTNGSTFLPFGSGLSITNTTDGNSEEILNLDSGIDGTIWVKVKNTDQVKGSQGCDTLYVDCMYFVSSDVNIPDDVVLSESGNQSPVANAGIDQIITDAEGDGEIVVLNGSASTDPDGEIVSYAWDTNNDGSTDLTGLSITPTFAIGNHIVTLTVTDNGDLSDSDQVLITVQAAGSTMHVHAIDIEIRIKKAGPNNFIKAFATVTIVDATDNPVEGATVYGHWSDATSDSDSGVTDGEGIVTLESDQVKSGTTFTFTVDNVAQSGWTYDPGSNKEDSDSISFP